MMPLIPALRCELLEDRVTPGAGDLDLTFGTGGTISQPLGFRTSIGPSDVTVLPDGRILSVGLTLTGTSFPIKPTSVRIARFLPNGQPDLTFGVEGRRGAGIEVGSGASIAMLPDGQMLFASHRPRTDFSTQAELVVARITADGALDPTFGTGGKADVTLTFPGLADDNSNNLVTNDLVVQPDGKIVVAGRLFGSFSTTGAPPVSYMLAFRVNADGSLDTTFGDGGKVLIEFGTTSNTEGANAVVLQPDGKIVLAGRDFAAARLLPDGQLDPSFGDGGKVYFPFDPGNERNDTARDVVLQPDGKIVLAGSVALIDSSFNLIANDMAVVRLNPDGSRDATFGTGGLLTVSFNQNGPNRETANEILIQPDGKMVLVGSATPSRNEDLDMAAARLLADGRLDLTFSDDGLVLIPFDPTGPEARAVALQPDGKIILAGHAYLGGFGEYAMILARLLGEDTTDPVIPPPPPPPGPQPSPQATLVGGSPDGSAVLLDPVEGTYQIGETFAFFPDFAGTVHTATADVTGDGIPDLIGAAGPGGGPRVAVIDGATGERIADFYAFEESFSGGVFVAAADMDSDGKAEIVASPDQGGGPVVAIFDGTGTERLRFFGIDDPAFRGGARVALGDVNGDGTPDVVVGAGTGGGPRVAILDGQSVAGTISRLVPDFFAFDPSFRKGIFVSAGDVNGDGLAELAFGAGTGGSPRVRLFDGQGLLAAGPFVNLDEVPTAQLANFFAGDPALRGGVRLALKDAVGDGTADLVTGSGEGEPGQVRVYLGANLLANANPSPDQLLDPFGAVLADGVYVG